VRNDIAYLHYTPNETVHGVEFFSIPTITHCPLVADMSSTLLSRPLDINRFGLIYAGVQKNIGPAGLTLVIVRDDLVGYALQQTPLMFNYTTHIKEKSLYNTPPTFTWYMVDLTLGWLMQHGGLTAMGQINERKAKRLYACIDETGFYENPVQKNVRG